MKINLKELQEVKKYKKPRDKKKYVGVEIECYGPISKYVVEFHLVKAGLSGKVQISEDGSIRPPSIFYKTGGGDYEIKVLDTQKNIKYTISKVCKVLKQLGCEVNKSCGLHVHLDMRTRDHETAYTKLVKNLPTLTKYVAKHRKYNRYCKLNKFDSFIGGYTRDSLGPYYVHDDRHSAINPHAYLRHKTLEVRLHEGSLDSRKINRWIKVLLKTIGRT